MVVISIRKAVAQSKTHGYGSCAEQTLDGGSYQVHNVWESGREWTPKQARTGRTGCGEGLDGRVEGLMSEGRGGSLASLSSLLS